MGTQSGNLNEYTTSVSEAAAEKYKRIMANREHVLEAFIAEVGLPPSELVIVERPSFVGRAETIYYMAKKSDVKIIAELQNDLHEMTLLASSMAEAIALGDGEQQMRLAQMYWKKNENYKSKG